MRKQIFILSLLYLTCLLVTGCGKQEVSQDNRQNSTVLNTTFNSDNEKETPTNTDVVDVDLTALSSTMVYAEVYNIMANPDDYMGKTIKMSGPYYSSFYEETGLYYHYVIIEDATACCQSGLEFVWNGEHSYPDDYPKEETKIEVTGIFESYEELGQVYYYLSVDDIIIL